MTVHLNRELFEGLLEGRLSVAEERSLLAHLGEDCEECERCMAALDDQQADMLIEIVSRAENATDLSPDAGRRLQAGMAGSRRGLFGMRPLLLPAAALGLLIFVGLGFALMRLTGTPGDSGERIKGTAATEKIPAIELTVGRLGPDAGNSSGLERIPPGGRATASERLAFRIDTSGACYLYLACVAGESIELITPRSRQAPVHSPGGAFTPEIAGHPAVFPLAGHAGRLRFVAVCAGRKLLHPLTALRQAADSAGRRTQLPGGVLSLDVRDVTVSGEVEPP